MAPRTTSFSSKGRMTKLYGFVLKNPPNSEQNQTAPPPAGIRVDEGKERLVGAGSSTWK
jgi:hypothetical protein